MSEQLLEKVWRQSRYTRVPCGECGEMMLVSDATLLRAKLTETKPTCEGCDRLEREQDVRALVVGRVGSFRGNDTVDHMGDAWAGST